MSVKLKQELLRETNEGCSLTQDINVVARLLNVSMRTLQRRRADDNTNFNTLLDDLKRDVVLSKLTNTALPIAEIGYSLGYCDISTFYRAFKRWTGSISQAG